MLSLLVRGEHYTQPPPNVYPSHHRFPASRLTSEFRHPGTAPVEHRDNLKAAVAQVLGFSRQRVETARWTAFRSHYGIDAFYYQPGLQGAHEKGGVEGQIGWFRRNHLVPVRKWTRLSSSTRWSTDGMLLTTPGASAPARAPAVSTPPFEQPQLASLPDESFETGTWLTPRVDRFSQIAVRTNRYSVPVRLVGRQVRIQLHYSDLVVHDGRAEIARPEWLMAKCRSRLDLDHYLEALLRKPGALPGATALEQARAAGKFTSVQDAWWEAVRRVHGDAAGTRALVGLTRYPRRCDCCSGLKTAVAVGMGRSAGQRPHGTSENGMGATRSIRSETGVSAQ